MCNHNARECGPTASENISTYHSLSDGSVVQLITHIDDKVCSARAWD